MVVDAREYIRSLFRALVQQINDDTAFLSNPRYEIEHQAMQQIVSLGTQACQLITDYWAEESNGPYLFSALRKIVGHDPPFPRQFHGRVKMLQGAWVSMLLQEGLIEHREVRLQRDGTWLVSRPEDV